MSVNPTALMEHCPKCGNRNTVLATLPTDFGGIMEFYSCHWCNHEWKQERHMHNDPPVAPV
jgi:DNA-directed RNA polymerase subunit M/transcription elongation factor TFIIS